MTDRAKREPQLTVLGKIVGYSLHLTSRCGSWEMRVHPPQFSGYQTVQKQAAFWKLYFSESDLAFDSAKEELVIIDETYQALILSWSAEIALSGFNSSKAKFSERQKEYAEKAYQKFRDLRQKYNA